ncbi:MAG: glucose 1-dehydrogenase [Candidatus Handelsmanbacteria bacterium]|nr:glucose 1-dehydrogenase [Candidatus Handelsmanbacteria bacterium]
MRLSDTVALITGAGSGIGRATAELFAREGARVVVADLRLERAEETVGRIEAAGGKALALAADVSFKDQVERMTAQALTTCGRVDVLVNCAAVASGDDILHIEEEEWDLNLRVVLKSVYLCCRAFLPGMIERRGGAIVNVSSVNGLSGLSEEAYSAAKAGVINLTRNLAIKYGHHQVRANAICPGTVRTPIWGPVVQKDPQIFEKLSKWYPLGRVGEPEDIARAALFLASPEASWITGEVLNVDGGLMAGSYGMSRALMSKEDQP